MSDPDQVTSTDAGLSVTITGEIIVAAVIVLFMLLIFTLILYVRANVYSGTIGSSRSRRLVFAPHQPTLPRHALDPAILNSLPVTVFRSNDFEEDGGLECAVCLSELTDGEEARLLPKCNHGFHVECIDMWFHSNSTCPLCRSPVEAVSENGHSAELPNTLTILDEGSSSSSSVGSSSSGKREKGMLVIEIPRRVVEGFLSPNSPLPSNRLSLEGMKSPALDRMRTLRRILSRGSGKGVGSSCTPRGCDIEQGGIAVSKRQ